jgi:hypothetical protein
MHACHYPAIFLTDIVLDISGSDQTYCMKQSSSPWGASPPLYGGVFGPDQYYSARLVLDHLSRCQSLSEGPSGPKVVLEIGMRLVAAIVVWDGVAGYKEGRGEGRPGKERMRGSIYGA